MNIFKNQSTSAEIQHTRFDMSNKNFMSTNFGALKPCYWSEVLPGDNWEISHNVLCKVAPLIAPAFTRIKSHINTFFVSNSSIWKYWNNFITNRPDDVFVGSGLQDDYENVYKVPNIPTFILQVICKIAYGNALVEKSGDNVKLNAFYYYKSVAPDVDGQNKFKFSYTLESDANGYRSYIRTTNPDSNAFITEDTDWLFPTESAREYSLNITHTNLSRSLGFYSNQHFFIDRCKSAVRLMDSFGIPTELLAINPFTTYINPQQPDLFMEKINALPFMAYSSIWHNYYRDPQLQSPELCYRQANGSLFDFNGGWSIEIKDVPPNALPDTPAMSAHISTYNVKSITFALKLLLGLGLDLSIKSSKVNMQSSSHLLQFNYYNGLLVEKFRNFGNDYFTSAVLDPMAGARNIDVPNTITELRSANKLQEFLERSAWSRDIYNFFKSHFGSTPESIHYNKPLLCGTQETPIQIGEQLQTSASTDDSPLGARAGVGEGFGHGGSAHHYFNEHGIIISIQSMTIDNQYYQGLRSELSHKDSYLDYPFPEFSSIGNQAIRQRELFYGEFVYNADIDVPQMGSVGENAKLTLRNFNTDFQGVDQLQTVNNNGYDNDKKQLHITDVFGYIPRYSDQKFKLDEVHGEFRSSLQFWHTSRHFTTPPILGHNFINYEFQDYFNNINRIFAVESNEVDHFYLNIYNNCSVNRCLPLVSTPKL